MSNIKYHQISNSGPSWIITQLGVDLLRTLSILEAQSTIQVNPQDVSKIIQKHTTNKLFFFNIAPGPLQWLSFLYPDGMRITTITHYLLENPRFPRHDNKNQSKAFFT